MMNDKKLRVRKSNNLVEAKLKLTLTEFRILLYCAAQIKPRTDDVPSTFQIHALEYARMFDVSDKNAYKQIQEGVNAFWEREFYEWLPQGKHKKPAWVSRRFIITRGYNESEGYGWMQMHPDFMDHLINLSEKYTDYALRHVVDLSSFSAIRIYELLAQYGKIGSRTFKVSWLQEVLSLEDSYKRWSDLRKHVIIPCLESIHDNTDIEIIKDKKTGWIRPVKVGKTVDSFTVHFRVKAQQTLDLGEPMQPAATKKAWEAMGYRTAGEYREACQLAEKHGTSFASAGEYLAFVTALSRKDS